MENIKPEVHVDTNIELENIRCCICFRRNTKENKKCLCSRCCNRIIIFTKTIKKPLHSFKKCFTE